ncbi:yhhn family protein [Histomonas meleagridis]|uniref:yhhn family protein n=1 Tax=Histomonas meleagridis TaxID=135588 RepID=UPI00355AA12C|nr:yhhn family protein [Histomonas meleagridis]KAH0806082.1 yhhn family protein [Histomonas meleagridis]
MFEGIEFGPYFIPFIILLVVNFIIVSFNLILGKGATFGVNFKLFVVTKLLIVPSAFFVATQLGKEIDYKITLFAVFTWLGDACLISRKFSINAIGAACFALGHLLLNIYFHIHWLQVPKKDLLIILPLPIIFLLIFVPHFRFQKIRDYFASCYFCLLLYNCACASARIYTYPITHPSYLMCLFGYIFFVISDSILVAYEMGMGSKKPHRFGVLSTYYIAQTLIISGSVLAL